MTQTPSVLAAFSNEVASLAERVQPSIVHVYARRGRPAHGVVTGPDLVLTMDHAIETDRNPRVRAHDGRTLDAVVGGRDSATNFAALRVPGLGGIPLVPAAGDIRPGSIALAIGRTMEGAPAASLTIVRSFTGPVRAWRGGGLERLVRTDGAFPSMLAGAALVDADGSAIGVVTAGAMRQAGLAVPASDAWAAADTLSRQGRIARGYLGVVCQPIAIPERQRGGSSAARGLLLLGVGDDSPAAHAGLLVGDILIAFGDRPLEQVETLHDLLARDRAGTVRTLRVLRGSTALAVEVTLGTRPER